MKKLFSTFLIVLHVVVLGNCCSCLEIFSFCELVGNHSSVLQVEVIDKYVLESGNGQINFNAFVMDAVIVKNIIGEFEVDTISVVNYGTSCDVFHTGFDIGDEFIITDISTNNVSEYNGRPYISPSTCAHSLLTLRDDNIVRGTISHGKEEQDYDDFISEINECQLASSLDRFADDLDSHFKFYPIPSSDVVFIQTYLPIDKNVTYELYSTSGQLLRRGSILLDANEGIDISTLSNGVHFLRIFIEDKVLTKKIVKI